MADKDSLLRLRLTAQNEASSAFTDLSKVMSDLMKSVEEAAKGISKSFRDVTKSSEDAVKSMTKGFEDEGKSIGDLNKTIETNVRSVEESFKSMTFAVEEAVKSASKGLSDFGKVSNESARDVQKSADEISSAIREVGVKSEASMMGMKGALENGGLLIGMQMLGDSMEHVGEQGEHLFVDAVRQSADFEQSLSDAKTAMIIMGTSMNDANNLTNQLKDSALEMGSRYHRSATEIGEAYATLVRNGVDAKGVVEGVGEATVATSMLTKSSAEETAAVMSDIFNEYRTQFERNGKSMKENFGDVTKGVVGAMYSARVSMGQFMNTMQYFGNAASTAGLNFKDVGVAIAEMARHGETGSRAGTALNMMLTRLIKPTKEGATALNKLGLVQGKHNQLIDESTGKLIPFTQVQEKLHDAFAKLNPVQQETYANMLFGQQHFQKLLGLVNDAPKDFQHMADTFNKIDIEKAMKTNLDNLSGDLMLLHANWDTMLKTFGDSIHTVLRPLVESLDDIVKKSQAFAEAHPVIAKFGMTILGIGSVAAIAGGALLGLVSTIGFLKMGLEGFGKLNPFSSITKSAKEAEAATKALAETETAASALSGAGGISTISKGAKTAKDAEVALEATTVAGGLSSLSGVVTKMGSAMKSVLFAPWIVGFKGIKSAVSGLGELMRSPLESIGKFGEALFKPLTLANVGLVKVLKGLGTFLNATFGTLEKFLVGAVKVIAKLFTFEGALSALKSAGSLFKIAFTALTGPWGILFTVITTGVIEIIAHWDTIKNWVKEHFGSTIPMTWDGLKQKADSIWNSIKNTFTTVWDGIKRIVQSAWAYIEPAIMGAVQKIQSFWNQVWPEIKQIADVVWKGIMVAAAPFIATVGAAIVFGLGFIKGAWHEAWELIKTTLKLVWDAIVNVLRLAWDIVSGIIKVGLDLLTGHWSKAWSDVKQLFIDVWNDIKKLVGDLVNDALQWGEHLVKMIGDGIMGGVHYVEDAVKSIAKKIWSFLGHGSPTEDGPGATSDQWMPNLINMMADGLNGNIPTISNAARNIAQEIANFLGFHSPTPEGPGSDADRWAPNFITMLSQGLLDGVPKVKDAVAQVAQAIKNAIDQMIQQLSDEMKKISDTASTTATDMQTAFINAFDTIAKKAQDTFKQVQQSIQQMQSSVQGAQFGTKSTGSVGISDGGLGNFTSSGPEVDGSVGGSRSDMSGTYSPDGGFTPGSFDGPKAAIGGVFDKPTIAMIGEAGREYVIPERFLKEQNGYSLGLPGFSGARGGGRGGVTINGGINITVQGAGKEGKQIGTDLATVLKQQINFAL